MNTFHLVSHTHWDREWYLPFQEFRLKLIHLMDNLLSILDHEPDYKYFLLDGQTITIEDYLEIRPERQSDLTRHIRNGRILIGPWYVSPDEFLISPESHVRNLLMGDNLCRIYGRKMLVGYLPDTFGHIGQMPQVLRGFGIETACVWRGLDNQPNELYWQAPDGSRVVLAFLRDSYSNAANLTPSEPQKFIKDINELSLSLIKHTPSSQVLLMHGGDHMEPSADLPKLIKAYQNSGQKDVLLHSNLPLYFDEVASHLVSNGGELPIVSGELRSSRQSALLQGVLSTRMWIKQRNHQCETELVKWVEPLNAWAKLLMVGESAALPSKQAAQHPLLENRAEIIHFAWKMLLQCHPHDSICGTTIDQVADELQVRFDQVQQITHLISSQCMQAVCDQIDTRFNSNSLSPFDPHMILGTIVIFNPNDASQAGLVNLDIKLDQPDTEFEILDAESNIVPYDHTGIGAGELISMSLDKKSMKQGLAMIHDGIVVGMAIRDFKINQQGEIATIHATLSDPENAHGTRWKDGVAQLDLLLDDPTVTTFQIHAYSDPAINLSIMANAVPGHGYKCYWLIKKPNRADVTISQKKLNPLVSALLPVITRISISSLISRILPIGKHHRSQASASLENDFFTLAVKRGDTSISVTDKRTGKVFQGINRLIDGGDRGDLYNYCPPEKDVFSIARIKKIETEAQKNSQKLILFYELKIPVGLSVDRKARSHKTITHQIKSTLTLLHGVPRVDVHTEIENQSPDHRLRVHFPAPFATEYALQDGHYEIIKRKIGLPQYDGTWAESPRPEVPQRQYTNISDGLTDMTIANRGLPEVEVFTNERGNAEISLTLLRCIGWLSRDDLTTRKGHAGPMGIMTPLAQMPGRFAFDYSFIPGTNDFQKSIHQAYAFNAELRCLYSSCHSGTMPSQDSLIDNQNEDFIITTIKQPELGDGLIIRGFNRLPSSINLKLKLIRRFNHVQIVGLNEELIEELPITVDGVINFNVDGNKIITLHIFD